MTQIGIPQRGTDDWDLPATQVAALVARQRTQRLAEGRTAEVRHLTDPADRAFADMACAHPEACSCAADYPGWTPGGHA